MTTMRKACAASHRLFSSKHAACDCRRCCHVRQDNSAKRQDSSAKLALLTIAAVVTHTIDLRRHVCHASSTCSLVQLKSALDRRRFASSSHACTTHPKVQAHHPRTSTERNVRARTRHNTFASNALRPAHCCHVTMNCWRARLPCAEAAAAVSATIRPCGVVKACHCRSSCRVA